MMWIRRWTTGSYKRFCPLARRNSTGSRRRRTRKMIKRS
jgi:hypothetical protein